MREVEIVQLVDEKKKELKVFLAPRSFGEWIEGLDGRSEISWIENIPENVAKDLKDMSFNVKHSQLVCGGSNYKNDLYMGIIDNAPIVYSSDETNYELAEDIHDSVYHQVINEKLTISSKFKGIFYNI